MTKRKSFLMIILVWLWSLIWAVPPIFGWGAYIPEGFQTSYTFDYLSTEPYMRSYIFGLYIGGFVIPLGIIIVCYAMILQAIRNHDKEMITMAKKLKADDIRANHEKSRTEIRIAKIAMGIVFLYILSWSPYATVALIGQFGPKKLVTPLVSELPVMLAKTCAMHNPIVYAFSHPKFREALRKRVPYLKFYCKVPQKQTKSTSGSDQRRRKDTAKRHVSRVTSADTNELPGSLSEASSFVSNIDDSMCAHLVHMNRTVSEMVPKGDYNDIVRELVSALVGVASRQQFLQPIYNPTEEAGSYNQVFSSSHGDISSYLSHLVSEDRRNASRRGGGQKKVSETQMEEAYNLLKEDSKSELLESSVV